MASLSDPNVINKLRSFGLQASSLAGVSSPTAMLAVAASDHQVAQTMISGAIVNDHSPVYVIEMTGGPFSASRPPKAFTMNEQPHDYGETQYYARGRRSWGTRIGRRRMLVFGG